MSDPTRGAMGSHEFDHWALTDDELEALLAGATPADLERVGNPVAEFFADARSGRGVQPPRPDASLGHFFSFSERPAESDPQPDAHGSVWSSASFRADTVTHADVVNASVGNLQTAVGPSAG